jgi:hypothetical protein
VPRIEQRSRSRESSQGRSRITQIGVVARGPTEMFAGKRQAQVTRIGAGVLAGSPNVRGSRGSSVSSRTAQLSSESCVQDRRLKLSEPTDAHTSSMMQALA